MHERHDLDLIAAYADGDLEGETTLAEELIASCASCRIEFDTQREMRALLREAPSVMMTEEERSTLRRAVLDQLDEPVDIAEEAPVISLDTRRRATRRWMALGSVAAATLVVVGVGGSMLNLLGGSDDSAGDVTASVEAADGDSADQSRMQLQVPDDEAAASDAAGSESATAMDDATETTAAEALEEALPEASFLPYLDAGPDPITEADLELYVSETVTALETGAPAEELTADWFNTNEQPLPECVTAVSNPVYAVINATVGDERLEVLVVLDPDSEAFEAVTFAVPGCSER